MENSFSASIKRKSSAGEGTQNVDNINCASRF